MDGRGTFRTEPLTPRGHIPDLGPASPRTGVQKELERGDGRTGGEVSRVAKAVKKVVNEEP